MGSRSTSKQSGWRDMGAGCRCGSIEGKTISTGRTRNGYLLRLILCDACGEKWTFIGGRIPESFWELDEKGRVHRREAKRRRAGYAGRPHRPFYGPQPLLRVKIDMEKPLDDDDDWE